MEPGEAEQGWDWGWDEPGAATQTSPTSFCGQSSPPRGTLNGLPAELSCLSWRANTVPDYRCTACPAQVWGIWVVLGSGMALSLIVAVFLTARRWRILRRQGSSRNDAAKQAGKCRQAVPCGWVAGKALTRCVPVARYESLGRGCCTAHPAVCRQWVESNRGPREA